MSLVADASVIVKSFVPEADSAKAIGILRSVPIVYVPGHALAEVVEVLNRKRAARDIRDESFWDTVGAVGESLTTIPLDPLLRPAARIAVETGMSIYDALYVACALRTRARLVTADRGLVARLRPTALADVAVLLADWPSEPTLAL